MIANVLSFSVTEMAFAVIANVFWMTEMTVSVFGNVGFLKRSS